MDEQAHLEKVRVERRVDRHKEKNVKHVNYTTTHNGKAAAVCCCCNRKSRPVGVCSDGEPDLWKMPEGWSQAPFPVDFRHRDGSTGSTYTCPECNKRLGIGRKTLGILRDLAREPLAPMASEKEPRGGARPGAGRRAKDGATGLVHTTLTIRLDQRAVLSRLGGSVWVRRKIDQEKQ